MTDLSELLRPLVEQIGAGPSPDEIAARAKSRRGRRRGKIVASAVAVATITVLSLTATATGTGKARIVTVGPDPTPSAARHASATTVAAPPPPAPAGTAALRLVLDHTVVPADGEPINGTVVVNNRGKPIWIGCGGWIEIGLANQNAPFIPVWPLVDCNPATPSAVNYIPTGVSRHKVTVATTYQTCSQSTGLVAGPKCLGPNRTVMPILPPGVYETQIYLAYGGPITLPPATKVTLTSAP